MTNEIQEQEGAETHSHVDSVMQELKTNSRKRMRKPEKLKRNLKKKGVNSGKSCISEGNRPVQEEKFV